MVPLDEFGHDDLIGLPERSFSELAITERGDTARRKMTLIVYAPALVGDDSRPVAVVHGMERAFPGLRLDWRVAEDQW
jgi:hypothetical protein